MFSQHDPLASPQYGNPCPCFPCLNLFRTMHGEIPSLNALSEQAFRFRQEGRYAAHPVEAALRYHRAQAENPARKATVASILNRPKSSTELALKGYDFLKSHSSRKVSRS